MPPLSLFARCIELKTCQRIFTSFRPSKDTEGADEGNNSFSYTSSLRLLQSYLDCVRNNRSMRIFELTIVILKRIRKLKMNLSFIYTVLYKPS